MLHTPDLFNNERLIPDTVTVIIPGNPGVDGFYKDFVEQLLTHSYIMRDCRLQSVAVIPHTNHVKHSQVPVKNKIIKTV